jgi:ABC-type transport system involved in multi-copper enzyme maturation permease subunit
MDAPTPPKPTPINRWLPYWAVFQADLRQTLCSWIYRAWVLVSALAALGYLMYRLGLHREAGMTQHASVLISDLLRWTVLGSVTLIIMLTVSSIASERGTLADAVLSRGISRNQYFLGKWHARLIAILATFLVMGLLALTGSYFLLHEDLSLTGGLVALATVAVLLAAVITCGVALSAVFHSTVLGIAVLWIVLYGSGLLLSLLPSRFPSPDRALASLPYILRGEYDPDLLLQLSGWCALVSGLVALGGLIHFSRCDV